MYAENTATFTDLLFQIHKYSLEHILTVSKENNKQNMSEFAIEYYVEGTHLSQRQKDAIEIRLKKLAQGHRDIAGASVAVECVSGANRRAEYRVRLVVYCKPSNIAATRTQDSVRGAISEALEAVVRQIREQRERMRDRHRTARV